VILFFPQISAKANRNVLDFFCFSSVNEASFSFFYFGKISQNFDVTIEKKNPELFQP
jgi:hypothetical protein